MMYHCIRSPTYLTYRYQGMFLAAYLLSPYTVEPGMVLGSRGTWRCSSSCNCAAEYVGGGHLPTKAGFRTSPLICTTRATNCSARAESQ